MRASRVMSSDRVVVDERRRERGADVRHDDEDADRHQQQREAAAVEAEGLGGLIGGRHGGRSVPAGGSRLAVAGSRLTVRTHRRRGTLMQGLMQDYPLTIPHLFGRAEQLFADKEVVTATATGIERTTYGDLGRAHASAGRRARRPRHLGRRAGRDVRLEHRSPPRAVLRGAVHRARAAHAEHPPVPRTAHLHRQPRRGRGDLRRPVAHRAAVAAAEDVRDRAPPRRDGRRQGRPSPTRVPTASSSTTTRSCSPPRRRSSSASTTRTAPRRCATRAARPATRRASSTRTARRSCTRWVRRRPGSLGASESDVILPGRADVPRERLGPGPRRGRVRRDAGDARPRPLGQGDRRPHRGRAGHHRGRRADDLDGCAARAEGPRHVEPAGDPVRWVGRAASAVRGLPRAARPADPAGVGDDRDEPDRVGRARSSRPS